VGIGGGREEKKEKERKEGKKKVGKTINMRETIDRD